MGRIRSGVDGIVFVRVALIGARVLTSAAAKRLAISVARGGIRRAAAKGVSSATAVTGVIGVAITTEALIRGLARQKQLKRIAAAIPVGGKFIVLVGEGDNAIGSFLFG